MKKEKKMERIFSIFNRYVEFYHNELIKNESYSNVREYLKNRSISKDQVKKFKIGYIEKNPNFFEKLKKDFSTETLIRNWFILFR